MSMVKEANAHFHLIDQGGGTMEVSCCNRCGWNCCKTSAVKESQKEPVFSHSSQEQWEAVLDPKLTLHLNHRTGLLEPRPKSNARTERDEEQFKAAWSAARVYLKQRCPLVEEAELTAFGKELGEGKKRLSMERYRILEDQVRAAQFGKEKAQKKDAKLAEEVIVFKQAAAAADVRLKMYRANHPGSKLNTPVESGSREGSDERRVTKKPSDEALPLLPFPEIEVQRPSIESVDSEPPKSSGEDISAAQPSTEMDSALLKELKKRAFV